MTDVIRTSDANTVIRVGDQFKMPSGSTWKVIRTRPGGVVELFNEVECRFVDCYHREVKLWERAS